uniref:GLOBIN domain-containing protein n=1 Tax=Heterorhabditis bacteriophora TaxID=37862 RepID=A0A1I7XC36_HETBA
MISQDHEQQILTPYQKMIIRSTWRHMSKKGQSSCGDTIMRRLLIKSDRMKTIFHHNIVIEEIFKNNGAPQSIKQHFVEIIQFLHYVMCNLDYPSKISEKCQEIGLQHRKYKKMGMKVIFSNALLAKIINKTIYSYPLQKTKVATGSSEMALELIFHKRVTDVLMSKVKILVVISNVCLKYGVVLLK